MSTSQDSSSWKLYCMTTNDDNASKSSVLPSSKTLTAQYLFVFTTSCVKCMLLWFIRLSVQINSPVHITLAL